MKLFLILVLLLFSFLPQSDKCATASLYLSQTTAAPGDMIGTFGLVTNCGTKATRFLAELYVYPDCGTPEWKAYYYYDKIPAGGAVQNNFPIVIPANGCKGTYTVEFEVLVGNTELTSAEADLVVQ